MLTIKNLTKSFNGIKAVTNCSFEIESNKTTALIGPNGSGKTTIFNLISGIIQPDQGEIIFNNKNITNYSIDQISNLGISRVFQQSRLFKNLTVKENLLLALDNQDTKLWRNIIGLNKITPEKEAKIKTTLKEMGILQTENDITANLSFGQKRLVELARALLNPHQILILDEPVAGVNPSIKNDIVNLILKLKKQNKTILLIEHDISFTFRVADHVIVLDAGQIIAQGTPNEIQKNKKVFEAYLGL